MPSASPVGGAPGYRATACQESRCREAAGRVTAYGIWTLDAVLLEIYAHCIDGQAAALNKRITDDLGTEDPQPEPSDEGDDESEQAS